MDFRICWTGGADFGRAKSSLFETVLGLANGITSHDTFSTVFRMLHGRTETRRAAVLGADDLGGCHQCPGLKTVGRIERICHLAVKTEREVCKNADDTLPTSSECWPENWPER